jgi:hypothetical protein
VRAVRAVVVGAHFERALELTPFSLPKAFICRQEARLLWISRNPQSVLAAECLAERLAEDASGGE